MSVLLDASTRLVVQGMTGSQGSFHTRLIARSGYAGRGRRPPPAAPVRGLRALRTFPCSNTVAEAVGETGANAACIFVPAAFAADAILEDAAAGLDVIVCLTEGIPILDMLRAMPRVRAAGSHLIGPNCPGVTTPGDGR